MVPHNGSRAIPATPPRDARAQSKLRVITVGKKILIQTADLVEHRPAVHRRTAIGPQNFLFAIKLPEILLACTAPAVLAVRINQMPRLIDNLGSFVNHDLGGGHPDIRLPET